MADNQFLAKGLFIVKCENLYIFLDISKDRYFHLSKISSQYFSMLMDRDGKSSNPDGATRYVDSFVKIGILTQDVSQGKYLASTDYRGAEFSIDQRNIGRRGNLATDLPVFLWALFSAIRFRRMSHSNLSTVIIAVKSWKSKLPAPHSDGRLRASALAQHFLALSPFTFTTHDACFFRSLFLVRYLALHAWQRIGCSPCASAPLVPIVGSNSIMSYSTKIWIALANIPRS